MGESGSFGSDALEDVVDERVHDAHGFAGDTSVRVNLLQHLVDVDSIAFPVSFPFSSSFHQARPLPFRLSSRLSFLQPWVPCL